VIDMEKELTIVELERQDAQLLPEREALGVFNFAGVTANNTALALNAATLGSTASAVAMQGITVTQA
jgi:hypothetical protein